MIEDLSHYTFDLEIEGDLAIVGAGPAGIVIALEAAARGLKVVLVESGIDSFDPAVQQLSAAATWDEKRHAPMPIAVRRQLGGTSTIWGGRCVPYDPVDFEVRPIAGSASWPIDYAEVEEYHQRACDWSVCGRAVFDASEVPTITKEIVPGLTDGDTTVSTLERWSLPTNFGEVYRARLQESPHVRLVTGVTCKQIACRRENRWAEGMDCSTSEGGSVRIRAGAYVIACGGLESTRLLMNSESPEGGQLGNESGHLGRWYMAHVEGVAARVQFTTPPRSTVFGYERDIDGVYIRRRFGFTREFILDEDLPNISGWITNPELADASHLSGPLSFVYLALASPVGSKFAPEAQRLSLTGHEVPGTPYGRSKISSVADHLRNVARHPVDTGVFALGFGAKRVFGHGRRPPGFFVGNERNNYPLQYHSEHLPHRDSRVTLSREKDALGRRKLNIDLRFSDADVNGVVRAHEKWDAHLRSCGVGWLEYLDPDIHGTIASRLGGGFHQVGTTRMSTDASGGVVDENLRVHSVDNVYVASSSTFVTSGQANSTFLLVALATRLADTLYRRLVDTRQAS